MLGKQDEVLARPTGAWREDAIKPQESCRVANFLGALVREGAVSLRRQSECFEISKIGDTARFRVG